MKLGITADNWSEKMFNKEKKPLREGDKVIVGIGRWVATVEKIWFDPTQAAFVMELDYGIHGKAKTYLHCEDNVWRRLENFN